jgi:catechol 2,3-dioxygenase-like lactoylglutathione lyase family enzyme
MPQSLAHVALIARDYDEAIAWFTEMLGFTLVADEYQPEQDKPQRSQPKAARRS